MSTDDSDRNDDGKDEPRAKDLLTRPREQIEQELDPATLAKLESWFGAPNLVALEDEAVEVAEQEEEDRELVERRKRREAACAAADPRLVARIEGYVVDRIRLTKQLELKPFVDESIVNIVVRAQLERQSAEEPVPDFSEYAQPDDVTEIIARHNAPQAILRDLYRPVSEFDAQLESPFAEEELPDLDPGRTIREALREHIKVEWPEPGFRVGLAARAEGIATLRQPWASYWEELQEIAKDRRARTFKVF